MYVVTVTFELKPEYQQQFLPVMMNQARNTLELEQHCHRFDVCRDTRDPCRLFLYELYTDEAAFQMHLQSRHFLDFASTTAEWVASKVVETWSLEPPPGR